MLIRLLTALALVLTLAFSAAPGGAESVFQGADPCTAKFVPGSDRWNQCKGIKKKNTASERGTARCRARCSGRPSGSARYYCMRACLAR
jgi:hypothetical protein